MYIRRLRISIKFVQPINFATDPYFGFISAIYAKLKTTICINKIKNCSLCKFNKKCSYFSISGEDFTRTEKIPVRFKRDFSAKHLYSSGETMDFDIMLFGKAANMDDYFIFAFNDFAQKGIFKQKYGIDILNYEKKDILLLEDTDEIKSFETVKIMTPINYSGDLIEYERKRLRALCSEHSFGMNDLTIECKNTDYSRQLIKFEINPGISVSGRKINYCGDVGKLKFQSEQEYDIFWKVSKYMGMGCLAFAGGGKIEFK